ncbi:hypothetical protein ES703_105253 [subsurface metagenome]
MDEAEKKSLMDIRTESFRLEIYEWDNLALGFVSKISGWAEESHKGPEEEDKKKPKKTLEEEVGQKKPLVSSAIMSSDHRLMKYGTTSVYKPILDFILEKAPEPFTADNVSSLIEKYYGKALDRTLKESTQELYANCYIRYMRESDPPIVERYEDLSVSPLSLYRRIKHVEEPVKIEKEERSDVAEDIYNLAEERRWPDRKEKVSVASIQKYLPEYSIDEIFSGITYLIKTDMVLQMSPDVVRF